MNFTEEASVLWDQLSEDEKRIWTANLNCQKCGEGINKNKINVSVHEGQIALFHMCRICGNKEVRLVEVDSRNQKEIDDDFNRWLEEKRKKHPEKFSR